MQLSTQCRACGTINISKYVKNLLSTNPTTLILSSLVSEFDEESRSEIFYLFIGRVAQSVGHLTRKSGVLGSIPGPATYFCFSFHFFKKGSVVSYWRKYVHEVLVNRLGGLSLPRKSVVRLTDHPDMTLEVYRGRKTTIQQQHFFFLMLHFFYYYFLCISIITIIIIFLDVFFIIIKGITVAIFVALPLKVNQHIFI